MISSELRYLARCSLRQMVVSLGLIIAVWLIFKLIRQHIHAANAALENPANHWVRYKQFCVRPYFYAGDNTTIRNLRNLWDTDDIEMPVLPTDDPIMFDDDLTLVTHISASAFNANYLITLARNWRGPISYGVYIEGRKDIEHVENSIKAATIVLGGPRNLRHLSVHLVIKGQPGFSCSESFDLVPQHFTDEITYHASYPINVIRNIARLFSNTRYILPQDADFIFSANFYTRMKDALTRVAYNETEKIMYYYRIFEIDEKVVESMKHSITKPDLKGIIDTDTGREFHLREWFEMHTVPLLREWLREPDHPDNNLFYEMPILLRLHPYWEFQFVSARNIPYFDENFPYGLMDNLHLRWELCRAEYKLLAINDLFAYHPIRKEKDNTTQKLAIKQMNKRQHYMALQRFNKRMLKLYPFWTAETCPVVRY